MLNEVQNNSLSFKAYVPETLGKKYCDKLGKYLLKKQPNSDSVELAKRYFDSIEKLKKDKNFGEILISYSTSIPTEGPGIIVDSYKRQMLLTEYMPKEIYKGKSKNLRRIFEKAYRLMQEVIDTAENSNELRARYNRWG